MQSFTLRAGISGHERAKTPPGVSTPAALHVERSVPAAQAAGGTGGHINPALAVASYIREKYPDSEILFVGTADHMESRLVPNAGFDFKTIKISGFRRSFAPKAIVHNIKTVCQLVTSNSACKKIIKDFKP